MRPPPPPTLPLVPLRYPTRYLYQPATESKRWPPMDTQGLAAERQAEPATTCRPPSHNNHLHRHAWTERIPASSMECVQSQDKFTPTAQNARLCKIKWDGENWKNLIMDIVCIVWNCLQSRNGSSLSLSLGACDRGAQRWRLAKKHVYQDCVVPMLKGQSTNFMCRSQFYCHREYNTVYENIWIKIPQVTLPMYLSLDLQTNLHAGSNERHYWDALWEVSTSVFFVPRQDIFASAEKNVSLPSPPNLWLCNTKISGELF